MGARRSRWRLPLAVAVGVVVLAVAGVHGRLPDPREVLTDLSRAEWGWILVAAPPQAVFLAAFAAQQRRVLVVMGVPMGRRDATGITLASTALSIAPPAGAVASTGYTIREYERAGATRQIGAAAAVVSGLTAAGATAVSATAAVLAYRLLSTWLLIPVGGAAAVARRYPIARAEAARPAPADVPVGA